MQDEGKNGANNKFQVIDINLPGISFNVSTNFSIISLIVIGIFLLILGGFLIVFAVNNLITGDDIDENVD